MNIVTRVLEALPSQAERYGVIVGRVGEVQQGARALQEVLSRTQPDIMTVPVQLAVAPKVVQPETVQSVAAAVVTGMAAEDARIAELQRIAAREADAALRTSAQLTGEL